MRAHDTADATRVHRDLDLRGEVCPLTFARAKVALEGMAVGEVLRVWVDHPASAENVPRSFLAQGQEVLAVDEREGAWAITVEKVREW